MRERAVADPVEQCVGVGRVEDLADRVAAAFGADAGRDGEQVQVVVAQDSRDARAEVDQRAQRGERAGAAVHDVAGDPERRIGGGGEFFQQRIES